MERGFLCSDVEKGAPLTQYGKIVREFTQDDNNYKLYSSKKNAEFTIVVNDGEKVVGPMSATKFLKMFGEFLGSQE